METREDGRELLGWCLLVEAAGHAGRLGKIPGWLERALDWGINDCDENMCGDEAVV